MQGIVLSHGDIVLTHGDIYLHGNQKKKIGGAIKPNDTIRRMTSQVNNPSTAIPGLGTQTKWYFYYFWREFIISIRKTQF